MVPFAVRRRPVRWAAAAGLLLLATAPQAGAQRVQVSTSEPPRAMSRADSLVSTVFRSDVEDVREMVRAWRERELKLVRELRGLPAEDALGRRRLLEELQLHVRDGAAMMSAVEARCVSGNGPARAGYLGLNTDVVGERVGTEVRNVVAIVKSVEPGSPAQRAGLKRDDEVLSIGGVSPHGSDVGELLVPGRSVVVRYLRDGDARETTVVVAKRPEGFGESCGEIERIMMPLNLPVAGRIFIEDTPGGRRVVVGEAGPGAEALPRQTYSFSFTTDSRSSRLYGGAEFRTLTEDWRETLGVKQGVLVSEVAPGSAVSQAGLRGGDVVTAVGKTPVTSPGMLVQLLVNHESNEAQLSIVRQKEKRSVTLRLGDR